MIDCLYKPFQHWAQTGSVYIMSDTHFDDSDCQFMDPGWITPEEQLVILSNIHKCDTLILLGDIGNPVYLDSIKAHKILITGNHDVLSKLKDYFDEIYDGPLIISDKIILSHEPIEIPMTNIHGHDHAGVMRYENSFGFNCLNLAANVCRYKPINLGKEIRNGLISSTTSIHRQTINKATEEKHYGR